jgi:glycerophosphoryl diester phosphodiesterase
MSRILHLAFLLLFCLTGLSAQPKIIAHRGNWDRIGAAQNSIAALKNAFSLGIYGSELDVWMSRGGALVINHDASYQGVDIVSASYDRLSSLQLSNGEFMPLLKHCLIAAGEQRGQDRTKLIIEIKSMGSTTDDALDYERRTAAEVVRQVEASGLADLVDYISFSKNICDALVHSNPAHRVAYLNGDLSPQQLKEAGYWGLDYHISVLRNHPDWVRDAHALGLTVNVWTVNKVEDMEYFIRLGVDYITTDNPLFLAGLLHNFNNKQK